MHPFRRFLISCLIVVILPWGALAQAASAEASFTAIPSGNEITVPTAEGGGVTAKQKRCRLAVLIGATCFAMIEVDGAADLSGTLREPDAPFSIVIAWPDGVRPEGHLDPPRRG